MTIAGMSYADPLLRTLRAPKMAVITAYLGVTTAAELMTAFISPSVGIAVYALLLFTLVNHAMLLGPEPRTSEPVRVAPTRTIIPILALLPMLRMFTLVVPTGEISSLYWYVLIGAPLLTAIVFVARYTHFSPVDARIWEWSPAQGIVGAAGIPLGVIAYAILPEAPVVDSHDIPYLLIGFAILLVCDGLLIELLFRALLQPQICALYGTQRGILFTAILSGVFSAGAGSVGAMLFGFVIGLGFGWYVHRYRSIIGVSIAHGMISIMTVLVLPNL
jgi:membrane protease YdiL (CAAX protease family)